MARLVLSHLVHRVVYGVEVLLLGQAGQTHLVFAGTGLGVHALVEVGLGVPYDLTEQFGEFRSVLGLLPCVALVGLGDLGITLAIGLTAHCQVHADLGALAHEVVLEALQQFGTRLPAVADLVLGNEFEAFALLDDFYELVFAYLAHRALLGCLGTFVDVTANGTTPFLSCHSFLLFGVC